LEVFIYISIVLFVSGLVAALFIHLSEPPYPGKFVDHVIDHRVEQMDQRLNHLEKRIDFLSSL